MSAHAEANAIHHQHSAQVGSRSGMNTPHMEQVQHRRASSMLRASRNSTGPARCPSNACRALRSATRWQWPQAWAYTLPSGADNGIGFMFAPAAFASATDRARAALSAPCTALSTAWPSTDPVLPSFLFPCLSVSDRPAPQAIGYPFVVVAQAIAARAVPTDLAVTSHTHPEAPMLLRAAPCRGDTNLHLPILSTLASSSKCRSRSSSVR